ncbi:MAG: SapC family protein, partial [Acidobacteria bacterium]|nr:SapC family protein [Acidobacteriota bacterium]
RYPFCMAKVTIDKVQRQDRLICVEKSRVDERAGEALFDASGKPSAAWSNLERLLSEYEAALERSREMCTILADYGLLEPFAIDRWQFRIRQLRPVLIRQLPERLVLLTHVHRVREFLERNEPLQVVLEVYGPQHRPRYQVCGSERSPTRISPTLRSLKLQPKW